uniref:Uncharacterized protein n=1 Tax=Hanusia phi TaxID=3032 RepID=A0A7S0HNI3_9CRYP|mmetsp:Transcript_33344/g.74750  ORF Transcript_33344/g.74750 Transcript_33344/m.74750 type:complete len:496 (+) Transcript_33344:109-1596(+)
MKSNVELLRALSSLTSEIDSMNDAIKKSYKSYKQRLEEANADTQAPSRRPVRTAGGESNVLVPKLLCLPTPQEMKLVQSARAYRSGIDYQPVRLFHGREEGSMTARCECCKRLIPTPRKSAPPRSAATTSRARRGGYDRLDEQLLERADTKTFLQVLDDHSNSMQVIVVEENVKLASPATNALQHRPIEHRLQRWWLDLAPSHRQNLYEEMLKSFEHASEIALSLVPEISETCYNPLKLSKLFREILSPWMIKPLKARKTSPLLVKSDKSMERARSVPTVQGGAYVFKISSQPPTSHESRMQRADVAISRAKTVLALREISHIINTTQARKSEFEPLPVAEEEQQEIGGGGERETEMQRNNSASHPFDEHTVSLTTARECAKPLRRMALLHWLLVVTMWYQTEGTWRVRELDETIEDRNLLRRIFREKDLSFLPSENPSSLPLPPTALARVAIKQGMGVSGGDDISGMFRRSIQILDTPRAKVAASLLSRGILVL